MPRTHGNVTRESIHTLPVSWLMLAIVVIGSSASLVLIIALEQRPALRTLLGRGDIPQNAFFFATQLLVVVGGLLFGVARLRPTDVGLVRSKLLQGVVTTILVWIVIQLTTVISEYLTAGG